jgi:hypothetical protein
MKKMFTTIAALTLFSCGIFAGVSLSSSAPTAQADEGSTTATDFNSIAKSFDDAAGIEAPTGRTVDISTCTGPLAGKIVFCDTIYTCYAFDAAQAEDFDKSFTLSSNLYERFKKVYTTGYRWQDSVTGATFVSTYGVDCGVSFRLGGNAKVYDLSGYGSKEVFKDGIPVDEFAEAVTIDCDYGKFDFYGQK